MRTVLLALLLCCLVASPALAAIYFVKPDGTGDFPTIQAAVDAAPAGSIIELADGVYLGAYNRGINFNGKSLTVRSRSGNPQACVIDCQSTARGFTFNHNETRASVVRGITIKNGEAEDGGGIYCDGAAPSLFYNIVDSCIASHNGGGLYADVYSDTMFVSGNVFSNNHAHAYQDNAGGGGVFANGGRLEFNDNVIWHNHGHCGGGINVYSCNTDLNNTLIVENDAYSGGGVYIYNCDIDIRFCTIDRNSANDANGGYNVMGVDGGSTISNCIVWNGTGAPPMIVNAWVEYSCILGDGFSGPGNIDSNPRFTSTSSPSGYYLGGTSPCIDAGNPSVWHPWFPTEDGTTRISRFTTQTALAQDTGTVDMGYHHRPSPIYVPDHYATIQGAIDNVLSGSTITVRAGTYNERIDFLGKAFRLNSASGSTATIIDGGAGGSVASFVSGEYGASVLEGVTLTNGRSTYGGGILCSGTSPTITGCIIYLNEAFHGGGGIACRDSAAPVLNSTVIRNNLAFSHGGGVYAEASSATLTNATLYVNGSEGYGAAVWAQSGAAVAMTKCLLTNNTANGFTIECDGGTVSLSCSDMYDNSRGDWTECVAGQNGINGNFSADPYYCDRAAGNLALFNDSPCAPGGSAGCGLVGALDVGCTYTPRAIRVHPDGTGDYPTIQSAIDASHDGDTVLLADGTFTGTGNRDLNFKGKAITVRSESGNAETCFINCQGSSSDPHVGFDFHTGETSASVLSGVSLINGYGSGNGGAIVCRLASSPTIEHCVLRDCSCAGDGAAVSCEGASSPNFVDCDLRDNTAGDDGGALMCRDGSNVQITDCLLRDNVATDAGGALYVYNAAPVIAGCTLVGNRATSAGAAMSVRNGPQIYVSNCIIGYHLQVSPVHSSGATVTLTCCDVYGNEVGNYVDGIAGQLGVFFNIQKDPWFCGLARGDLTLNFDSPCAAENYPACGQIGAEGLGCEWGEYLVKPDGTGDYPTIQAAIDASSDGDTVLLADGTYTGDGNRDLDYGARAITVRSQSGQAADCTIECEGSTSTPHRGFYFHSGEDTTSVLQNVTVQGGYATSGGGVLCVSGSGPKIVGCVFQDNDGVDGGGMLVNGSSPVLVGCTFLNNTTTDAGGALALNTSQAQLRGCVFQSNSSGYGGGVYNYAASPTLYNCLFTGNSATYMGGGLHNTQASSAPLVSGCTFRNNMSSYYGGAIYNRVSAHPTITRCTLAANSAPTGGGLYNASSSAPVLGHTLIAFSADGQAVYCASATATLSCCDLYGNADGNWVGTIAGQLGVNGNIEADPLLCGLATGDLTVRSDSPCAAANNPGCGQIGAHGVGCQTPPEIAVNPPFLAFHVAAGGTQCANLSIHNAGGADLAWWLTESAPDKSGNAVASVVLADGRLLPAQLTPAANPAKSGAVAPAEVTPAGAEPGRGEPDGWSGMAVVNGSGGPDALGYAWIDSDDPAGPVFDWVDIRDVGTPLTLGLDDFEQVELPFPFPFYGIAQDSVKICSHAYLTFGTDGIDYSNDPIPTATDPNGIIALFWDDISTADGDGTVHYWHDADNDRFIVQYTEAQRIGGSSPCTMEAILYPDGTILLQYQEMLAQLTSATVGIENAAGSVGLQVVANATYVHDDMAVLIRQDELPWLTATPPLGVAPGSVSATVQVCVDATGLAAGTYEGTLLVHSNDADEPTVTVPVTLVVGTADILGVYTAHDGTGVDHLSVAPATPFSVYLTLAGASRTAGLSAWEARLTTSANVTIQSWSYQGTGLPMGGFPGNFMLAYTSVMPYAPVIWLGTVQAVVTDNNPGYIYLAPHVPSSISPPAPCYIPWGSSDLVPMTIVSGSSDVAVFVVNPDATGAPEPEQPQRYALLPCYPNPFNPSTTIAFELPEAARVRLQIYDQAGRLVRSLIAGEARGVGRHETVWRGEDDTGRTVPAGTYFARLDAGSFRMTRKLALVK